MARKAGSNSAIRTGPVWSKQMPNTAAKPTWCARCRVLAPCRAQPPNMPTMLAMYLRCSEGTTTRRRIFHTSPSAGISPSKRQEWLNVGTINLIDLVSAPPQQLSCMHHPPVPMTKSRISERTPLV